MKKILITANIVFAAILCLLIISCVTLENRAREQFEENSGSDITVPFTEDVFPLGASTAELPTEEPSTERLSTEEPSTEKAPTEEPSTEEPSTEKAPTEKPSTQKAPTEEPSTEKTSTEETPSTAPDGYYDGGRV